VEANAGMVSMKRSLAQRNRKNSQYNYFQSMKCWVMRKEEFKTATLMEERYKHPTIHGVLELRFDAHSTMPGRAPRKP
jgi:hypothetical protein